MKARLDAIDWRILAALQENAHLTNVALARRAGISAPACLRRVRALEEAGVIAGYRARLDPQALGFEAEAFIFVGLVRQAEPELAAFEALVAGWPLVRECHLLSGEVDFLLKCVAADLAALHAFVLGEVTRAPNVQSVRTNLVVRRVKDAGGVPTG